MPVDKDKLTGLSTYIDGKMKRYNLLFAVNGGAFALAKLLADPKTENILGKLTLKHLAIGAIAFTFLMWFDIWLFGENMRTVYFDGKEVFQWRGKAILSLLASLVILGWLLATFETTAAIVLFTSLVIAGALLLYVPYKRNQGRSIDVFFYGLFMDEGLLREKGMNPRNRRMASVENFSLVIGARATLVPCPGGKVYGVVFSLTQNELDALYSEASVIVYRPEALSAQLADGSVIPGLYFNLPVPPATDERNPQYVAKLRELAERIGLPPSYVSSIK